MRNETIGALANVGILELRKIANATGWTEARPYFYSKGKQVYLHKSTLFARLIEHADKRGDDGWRRLAVLLNAPSLPMVDETPAPFDPTVPEAPPLVSVTTEELKDPTDYILETHQAPGSEPEETQPTQPTKRRRSGGIAAAIDEAIADAVAAVEKRQTIDEAAVRIIVDKALRDRAPLRVEVVTNGKTHVVEGLAHERLPFLIRLIARGRHAWLAGPSGSGKTHAAAQAFAARGLTYRGAMGACLTRYDLLGFVDANGRAVPTPLRTAIIHGGGVTLDEVDAYGHEAYLALNGILGNGHADLPGEPDLIRVHDDCAIVATANTWGNGATSEYIGRNRMDEAFLKRFVRMDWPYDEKMERQAALAIEPGDATEALVNRIQALRKRAADSNLRVVISPRQSILAASMVRDGFTPDEAIEATCLCGMTDANRRTLEA